jgi:hypothetical protein
MPRETIKILIRGAAPFEAASQLMSHVAYPNKLDKKNRERFADALCRAAHLTNEHFHKGWCRSPQQIKPHIFYDKDGVFQKSLNSGTSILMQRSVTSLAMLGSHLEAVETGRRPPRFIDLPPTVENVSIYLMDAFRRTNLSTFKTKVWGPARPVAHMAFATSVEFIPFFNEYKPSDNTGIPIRDLFGWLFPSDDFLYAAFSVAERIRLSLPQMRQFHFKEDETIQFVAV